MLRKYLNRYTSINEDEQRAILDELHIEEYEKGTTLIRQGDVPTKCYFILKGCVRQYSINEEGKEVTSNFYTEEQSIAVFNHHKTDKSSAYSFTCLEHSVMVVGDLETEADMYNKYQQLAVLTSRMVEANFSQFQDDFAAFIAAKPEERFRSLLVNRPQLIDRVPQHQLASYLGVTPETLSRIKKRMTPL